jgi:chloramphenicol-sensitive protein RarD
MDLDRVHGWLSEESYWAAGRPRAVVDRSFAASLGVGVYDGATQVAVARVVTDRATFAWVCDVFVDAEYRGRGIGTWLMAAITEHLRDLGVLRVVLATGDAHAVYAKVGFRPLAAPERWMEIDRRGVVAEPAGVSDRRRGVLLGLTAYFIWGLFPLYWPLLEPAGAVEILANRIVWSLAVVLILLLAARRWSWIRPLLRDRRRLGLLVLAGFVIAVNWGIYIYGVNSGHVVETSLGYFINPLLTVALGVLVLGEHLRWVQWVAVGLGSVAVVVLTVDYGRLPWIALLLAASFGTYGLVKKTVGMGPVESLAVETSALFVPAMVFLLVLQVSGRSTFLTEGPGHAALLAATGVVTAVPLLAFGGSANRVPLTWLGIMQYLTPVMQFMLGILVFHEAMPPSRWIGFGLVWLGLLVISVDSIWSARRRGTVTDIVPAEAL